MNRRACLRPSVIACLLEPEWKPGERRDKLNERRDAGTSALSWHHLCCELTLQTQILLKQSDFQLQHTSGAQ
eukprot:scaffold184870_cov17-Tisochrysis_lutea.AAC.1